MNNKENAYLKLYELYKNDEFEQIKNYENRLGFYMGLITAVIAGIVAGIFKADTWYEFLAIAIASLLLVIISDFAEEGTFRIYRRGLETITMLAKIETELELTKPRTKTKNDSGQPWETEPIVPERYLKDRLKYSSSQEFIDQSPKQGYQRTINKMFKLIKVLGLLLFLGLTLISISFMSACL